MGNWYTDVIQKDRRFNSLQPVYDPSLLEPTFFKAILALLADARAQGHDLRIGETYRSQTLQAQYFREGKTRLPHVGLHHYGLAADLKLFVDGAYDDKGEHYYPILYPLCVKYKLVLGADWGHPPPSAHSFNDWDHIQRVDMLTQQLVLAGTFYPDENWVSKAVG